MEIKIVYLYYDFLNLYGESGNIKFLKNTLESLGIKVTIKLLSLKNKLSFKDYDLVYIGAGTEENQQKVLEHLSLYQKDILKYINQNKFFLATGNSVDLLGKTLMIDGKKVKGLNIFNYNSVNASKRLVGEAIFETKLVKRQILGFQNQNNEIRNIKHSLFEVKYGIGSYENSIQEGIHYKNFYGTYLLGPLLVRNPSFGEYFIKKMIKKKYPKQKVHLDLKLEKLAYNDYIEKNYKDVIEKND